MEQRNGRIDRKLQRAPEVRCHYFVLTQREEDRVLEVLVEKTVRIRRELGSLGAVVERRLSDLLEKGIPLGQIAALTRSIDDESPTALQKQIVQQELEEARERDEKLSTQIEVLRKMLGAAKAYLQLDEEAFRQAISRALELLPGGEALRPIPDPKDPGGPPLAWSFPELSLRRGADPTWLDTLDTLRAPRRRDQDLREWRRTCPLRPIVFQDVGSLDEAFVHFHLEHRVAQRLLGRLLSQGFVHDDLSRACVVLTDHTEPTVVLLGRLALYGEQAARLHDEILAVAAPWVDPVTRRGGLRAMSEADKEDALRRVERSLADPALHRVPDDRKRAFAETIERDVEDLLPRLAARGEARAKTSERELGSRADKEASAMEKILRAQAARIQKQHAAPQLELQLFTKEEKRQLDADRSHWEKRMGAIDREIEEEPEKIRRGYASMARTVGSPSFAAAASSLLNAFHGSGPALFPSTSAWRRSRSAWSAASRSGRTTLSMVLGFTLLQGLGEVREARVHLAVRQRVTVTAEALLQVGFELGQPLRLLLRERTPGPRRSQLLVLLQSRLGLRVALAELAEELGEHPAH
jgi:hypothetical protein